MVFFVALLWQLKCYHLHIKENIMKRKTSLLLLSSAALMLGAFAVFANAKHNGVVKTEAANYTRADKSFTLNEGAVSATFTVDGSNLNMEGWLLCLLDNKPVYDSNNKLDGANGLHPYLYENCAHYFFAASNDDDDTVSVTWAANSADQKQAWSENETAGAEGKTLADYMDDKDWYIVIGPRHKANYGGSPSETQVGAGYNDHWENCDYYVGQKSKVLIGAPIGETYIDLTESSSWLENGAKIAVEYSDAGSNSEWSEFASKTNEEGVYSASYELSFKPTKMRVASFASNTEAPSSGLIVNASDKVSFFEYGVAGVKSDAAWSEELASIKGLDKTVIFESYRRNDDSHIQYIDYLELDKDNKFVVTYGKIDYYSFVINSAINDNFSVVDDKINVVLAGTYSLSFDSTNKTIYITTVKAAVDSWSSTFLGDDCGDTKDYWKNSKTLFKSLSYNARQLILEEEHYTHDETVSTLLKRAVQRYDYVIELYGTTLYEDFIGRVNEHDLVPGSLNGSSTIVNQGSNTGLLLALIAISSITLAFTVVMAVRSKGKNK